MTKPALLAIDLDGTLVDSAPDLSYCLGQAMLATGRPAPGDTLTRSLIGDGIESLLERALAMLPGGTTGQSDDFTTALETFSACYRDNIFTHSSLYPQVVNVLDALRDQCVRLCCITNKRIRYAEAVLQHAGIHDRFELILGGDSLPEKKPSPLQLITATERLGVRREDAVMFGDSYHDLDAARDAGFAGFVWARYGYCAALNERDSDVIAAVDRFEDLPSALKVLADLRHPPSRKAPR